MFWGPWPTLYLLSLQIPEFESGLPLSFHLLVFTSQLLQPKQWMDFGGWRNGRQKDKKALATPWKASQFNGMARRVMTTNQQIHVIKWKSYQIASGKASTMQGTQGRKLSPASGLRPGFKENWTHLRRIMRFEQSNVCYEEEKEHILGGGERKSKYGELQKGLLQKKSQEFTLV